MRVSNQRLHVAAQAPFTRSPTNGVQYTVRFAKRNGNGFVSDFSAPKIAAAQVSRPVLMQPGE